ncbi:hypothetical protein ENFAE_04280 [Enterococcus faecalis]|uniref:hypothetical protein n=1 Tax=Enterococcus faecalis TaxID=1351 RepID=UPI000877FE0C|nr:hypothetical protein [Enterococcus faecalis]OFA14381.1 hypothetical protein ENFAE_04280 [Enterococcus faecalis]
MTTKYFVLIELVLPLILYYLIVIIRQIAYFNSETFLRNKLQGNDKNEEEYFVYFIFLFPLIGLLVSDLSYFLPSYSFLLKEKWIIGMIVLNYLFLIYFYTRDYLVAYKIVYLYDMPLKKRLTVILRNSFHSIFIMYGSFGVYLFLSKTLFTK